MRKRNTSYEVESKDDNCTKVIYKPSGSIPMKGGHANDEAYYSHRLPRCLQRILRRSVACVMALYHALLERGIIPRKPALERAYFFVMTGEQGR